jgi:hypothetical protein
VMRTRYSRLHVGECLAFLERVKNLAENRIKTRKFHGWLGSPSVARFPHSRKAFLSKFITASSAVVLLRRHDQIPRACFEKANTKEIIVKAVS